MKKIGKKLISRNILVLGLLIAGLAITLSVKPTCVGAQSCSVMFDTWTNANWAYSAAFGSYYLGIPNTCEDVCYGNPSCISECMMNRGTILAQANIALFEAAWDTCTPATLDQCDQARLMADNCALEYNYLDYPNQEESLAIYAQYSACILASKINSCL